VLKFGGRCREVVSRQVFKSIEPLGNRFHYTETLLFLTYLIVR
jgi:hypothetical protein